MSQQKWGDITQTFLSITLNSAILDSDAPGTVCGTKWYECFLGIIPEKQRQKIKISDGVMTDKFDDRNKLKSTLHSHFIVCKCRH